MAEQELEPGYYWIKCWIWGANPDGFSAEKRVELGMLIPGNFGGWFITGRMAPLEPSAEVEVLSPRLEPPQ
jgi:hypothetical protein